MCEIKGWTGEVCANRCPAGFYGKILFVYFYFEQYSKEKNNVLLFFVR